MKSGRRTISLRDEGHLVEALLLFLKQLTAHARWVFAALLLLYGLSGIHTIQPQQSALVRRLGTLQPDLHGPGLLLGLPRPFDEVLLFETGKDSSLMLDAWALIGSKIGDPDKPLQLSDEELTKQLISRETEQTAYPEYANTTLNPLEHGYTLTKDTNVIQGRFTLRYRIEDPFHYTIAGDQIENLLARLSYRALSSQLATRRIDASLTDDRRDVASESAKQVQAEASRLNLGVQISGMDIRELSPPAQVLAAFEEVTNARQYSKTMFENARQYDAETRAKFEGEAASILFRTEGYATNLTETARGEASAFTSLLKNYRTNPQLVSQRILRETLDSVMGQVSSRTLLPIKQARPSIILEPSPEFAR
ncbi:MAG: SPFH domain-containing protein [Prosthecobacter sp.]|nr:SPFH domain-containing protein [Prosthecobacter sp.]